LLDIDELYNIYMEYKSNKNVVYSCKYHVVFCPKYRRNIAALSLLMELMFA